MWICRNCQTENENNFRFCWSCGQNKPKLENLPEPPPKPETNPVEKIAPPKSVEKIPEIEAKPEIKTAPAETVVKPHVEQKPPNQQRFDDDVMPMFSHMTGVENKIFSDDSSLERKVFTIAVRLVGLLLFYQVLIALPDFIVLVNASVKNTADFSDALTKELIIPFAKLLFYFAAGIYLIASGKILLRILPD